MNCMYCVFLKTCWRENGFSPSQWSVLQFSSRVEQGECRWGRGRGERGSKPMDPESPSCCFSDPLLSSPCVSPVCAAWRAVRSDHLFHWLPFSPVSHIIIHYPFISELLLWANSPFMSTRPTPSLKKKNMKEQYLSCAFSSFLNIYISYLSYSWFHALSLSLSPAVLCRKRHSVCGVERDKSAFQRCRGTSCYTHADMHNKEVGRTMQGS